MHVKYSTSIDNVLTVFTIAPCKRLACETRVEVRGHLVDLQSSFEDCQLGTLYSSHRNGLLFRSYFNNRPLVT